MEVSAPQAAGAGAVALGRDGFVGRGRDGPGSGTRGTPGVPICPASQGSAAANAREANGQSCLPLPGTTAQSIPYVLPSAHSEFAAAV